MKPIYEPKGKAKEYGDYAINIYTGCPHWCYYCFAPNVLHKQKEQFHSCVEPRKDIIKEVQKQVEREKITDKPLLAGMIGPYSLAGRLMDVTEIMYTCYDEPETVHKVLEKATQFLISYGAAMKEAGADGVMMAEPLAGILSPDMAEEFSFPYVKRIIDALQTDDFAVIYHNCGNSVASMLDGIFAQGAAAYHFGNAVDMEAVMKAAPEEVLCMGNIDPASQFANGTPESMTAATRDLMARCGGYRNFVPSSGCDIPAHSHWENIEAFFKAL